MTTLNKTQLVKQLAAQLGMTQRDVAAVVDALIDTVVDAVKSGKVVSLHGLGRFYRHTLKERQVRVPGTDRVVKVGGNVPRFKPAKAFKEAVK